MHDETPPSLPSRARIEAAIEALVALLDEVDGDPDREEDDEDACTAFDDWGGQSIGTGGLTIWSGAGAGDPEDAEDNGDQEADPADAGRVPGYSDDPDVEQIAMPLFGGERPKRRVRQLADMVA